MHDITELFQRHRECSRHLWNTYFWPLAEANDDWDLRDRFEDLSANLFATLVLRPLEKEDYPLKPSYELPYQEVPFVRIVPKGVCEALVNREVDCGYWDHPITVLTEGDVETRFIHHFDWWNLGHRDYEFVRVLIVSSVAHPELNGRHALLRPFNVRVEFDGTVL